VSGTLLAAWTEGHTDPWLVLTDLAPHRAQVAWYGLRTWIEASNSNYEIGRPSPGQLRTLWEAETRP